jgi:hypothetical protein
MIEKSRRFVSKKFCCQKTIEVSVNSRKIIILIRVLKEVNQNLKAKPFVAKQQGHLEN